MISSLFIDKFKCFEHLELDNLKMISLISGKNNVGKTSLLEAIFFTNNISNPNTLMELHNTRGIPVVRLSPDNLWGELFYNRNIFEPSIIKENIDGENIELKSYTMKDMTTLNVELANGPTNITMTPMYSSLISDIIVGDKKRSITTTIVGENSVNQKVSGNSKSNKWHNVIFIDTKRNHNIIEYFGKIDNLGKSSLVVDALRIIEPTLKDLSVAIIDGVGQFYASVNNSSKKTLVKSMGDGLNRLLDMIITIISNPNSVILIDEIENGFHYSIYQDLWKVLVNAADRVKSQLIITTHSYECISSAVFALTDTSYKKEFEYIRIDKEDNGYIPKYYDWDLLRYTVENNVEVR